MICINRLPIHSNISLRFADMDTVVNSISKTHHLVTVEQGWPSSGIGAEISARIVESKDCVPNEEKFK